MNKTLVVLLDDDGGMMYNNRRQSRDRELISELMQSVSGTVHIAQYSNQLFLTYPDRISVCEDPLGQCGDGGICLIEDPRLIRSLDGVSTLIIYRWGKLYPKDLSFSYSPECEGFTLAEESNLVGSSHDKIWKGIYKR